MSDFKPPSWAGKAEPGAHLDVTKDGVLVGKYPIDVKNYYLFGRNPDLVDFPIDHVSCSRVHAALVHHKSLKRPFLLDLGSTHGTFVGNIRLEPNKPQQLFPDISFHFGASTRIYCVCEKAKAEKKSTGSIKDGEVVLPSSQHELDTLTSYNTGQNCRMLDIKNQEIPKRTHVKRKHVSFTEEEEIINLEDSDPTIGRFQNLVATEVIAPAKKFCPEPKASSSLTARVRPYNSASRGVDLYDDLPSSSIGLPNSAPDVESGVAIEEHVLSDAGAHHKKYAKEVWPGKAPHLPKSGIT